MLGDLRTVGTVDIGRILNLGLLLDYIEATGSSSYAHLISKSIALNDYRQGSSIAAQFCAFVDEHVLAQDLGRTFSAYSDVIRFLILLLPVDHTYTLSSPAYKALLQLMKQVPERITSMLLSFLKLGFEAHEPFVWRLLYEAMRLRPDDRITAAAEAALQRESVLSYESATEIKRIILAFAAGDGRP